MAGNPIPIRRGDIYYINFGELPGSTEHGTRPGMIVQNNIGNRHAPTVIVAAITSSVKKLDQPTHVLIGSRFGLDRPSMLMAEQLFTVDKFSLLRYIGTADSTILQEVNRALNRSIGLCPDFPRTDRGTNRCRYGGSS